MSFRVRRLYESGNRKGREDKSIGEEENEFMLKYHDQKNNNMSRGSKIYESNMKRLKVEFK